MPRLQDCRILPLLALAGALCGCGTYQPGASTTNLVFSIGSSANHVTTNGQDKFSAIGNDGAPVAVNWTVSGDNSSSFGQGRIDANGLYTPPAALSDDRVEVRIKATLQSNPAVTATSVIDVTPGFIQSLLPENATLPAGGSLEIKGEIAEVGAGSVAWKIAAPSDTGRSGTLTPIGCDRAAGQYTTCRASYTAPTGLGGPASVYIHALVNGIAASPTKASGNHPAVLHILLNRDGLEANPALDQAAQSGPVKMGSSGGNENDYDTFQSKTGRNKIADCCGGTLGALLRDSAGNEYILSNNHVLAESDQAEPGDSIVQPGLIDTACRPPGESGSAARAVGVLSAYAPLSSPTTNIDAAIAAAAPGAIDNSGSILNLGSPSEGTPDAAPPMAGTGEALTAANLGDMRVAKSGRTTGLTCSTVNAVDLSVKVDYFKDCAETEPYTTRLFTGQIGIAGDSFADSGDSGSLVVDTANAQPLGLLFATGTDGKGGGMSVANPIGDVLGQLSKETGSQLTVAGTSTPHPVSCLDYETGHATQAALAPGDKALARRAAQMAASMLMNRESGVLGVAPGQSADSPGDPAVIVYVDAQKRLPSVPETIYGVRTAVIATDAASVTRGSAPSVPAIFASIHLPANVLAHAVAVQKQVAAGLFADPAIFGVGVTQSEDNPEEAALLVLVDISRTPQLLPRTAGGLRIRYLRLHRLHVTRSKQASINSASRCLAPAARSTGR